MYVVLTIYIYICIYIYIYRYIITDPLEEPLNLESLGASTPNPHLENPVEPDNSSKTKTAAPNSQIVRFRV